jgi:3-oxoacyl-[acyl-carrier protein] reductase
VDIVANNAACCPNAPMDNAPRRAFWQGQAIQRFGEPPDVLGPVPVLTADDAAFMTGRAPGVEGDQYRAG